MEYKIINLQLIPQTGRSKKDKIFIFPEGENLIENIINRHSRPHNIYRKEIIPLMLKKLKKEFTKWHYQLQNTKWKWDQKAGCSCGCSPGFVGDTDFQMGIYVTIKEKK